MPSPILLLLALVPSAPAKELGLVEFGRSYEAARTRATEQHKPMLILFDEVPGCATCVRYGQVVLSDPLLVEAAESLFVPVAIYNNLEGEDRRVLALFGEPAWNNPVVRIVDERGRDLAPRLAGDYSPAGLARAMRVALTAARQEVPEWLRLHEEGLNDEDGPRATAHYAMGCFWAGEACFGRLSGVVDTRTGFIEGHEVVEVAYRRDRLEAKALEACGRPLEGNFRPSPSDDHYHLRRSPFAALGLSLAQARRVNAALAQGADPSLLLSPRQRARLSRAERER